MAAGSMAGSTVAGLELTLPSVPVAKVDPSSNVCIVDPSSNVCIDAPKFVGVALVSMLLAGTATSIPALTCGSTGAGLVSVPARPAL